MGYGIKDENRRWPHIIFYEGTTTDVVLFALAEWSARVGSLQFLPAGEGQTAMFTIKINPSGSCLWRSGDNVNGRCPGKKGELVMREGAPRGAALHEVGHLLGLAHEMDRQGCPDAQSWTEEKVKPKRSAAKSDEEHRFAIGGFNMLQDAAASKTRFYRNVETFDRDSVMLYGNGYEARATISDGDVKAVRLINSWPAR